MKVTIETIVKTVAATVTPEALTNTQIITNFCKIKALASNTGLISIGDSENQDFSLSPGEMIDLSSIRSSSGGVDELDLSKIWLKAGTNGNGVCVVYSKKP